MQLNRSNVQAYKLETERHTTLSNKLKKIDMQVHITSKSCNRMQLTRNKSEGKSILCESDNVTLSNQ